MPDIISRTSAAFTIEVDEGDADETKYYTTSEIHYIMPNLC